MDIPFESLSLDYIKEKLDWYKENYPERMACINIRAENLTEYGIDIYGSQKFPELLHLFASYDEVKVIQIAIGMALPEITDDILKAICDCNKLKVVPLNPETGKNRLLDVIEKGITVERINYIFNTIRTVRPDIEIACLVIIGFPTETITDMYELAVFMSELKPDGIKCNCYTDSPGLPLHELPQLSQELVKYHLDIFLKEFSKHQKRNCLMDYPKISKSRKYQRWIERKKHENNYFSDFPYRTELWCCEEK